MMPGSHLHIVDLDGGSISLPCELASPKSMATTSSSPGSDDGNL